MTPWTADQLDYCVGLMRNHASAGIPQAALARYLESQRNRALWAGEPVIATGLEFAVARVRAAFYYVRENRTVRPADLLDADGLAALIENVPAELAGKG